MTIAFFVARLLAGGYFVWSGSQKIGRSRLFWSQIMGYELVGALPARAIAAFLPALELITGLFFAAGLYPAVTGSVLVLFLIGFSVAIVSSLTRKLGNDCGCGGQGKRVSPQLLVRNGLLAALTIAGIFSQVPTTQGAPIAVTLGALLAVVIGTTSYRTMGN